ncbi:hypothetical protein [Bacillus sp. FJAT-27251]|uniref:hypothetical protein n=1 Tax=Bacillus sp. FJAT-27251 TaxID=1684142 RepID=UPI0006A7682E|nr:hypothetical protein [Bacillus sp. FJAT-27251]
MVECPFCDGQGIVHRAEVKKLNRTIFICDECDTIWLDGIEINEENARRFDQFMSEHGLPPLWSELE